MERNPTRLAPLRETALQAWVRRDEIDALLVRLRTPQTTEPGKSALRGLAAWIRDHHRGTYSVMMDTLSAPPPKPTTSIDARLVDASVVISRMLGAVNASKRADALVPIIRSMCETDAGCEVLQAAMASLCDEGGTDAQSA